MKRRILCVLLSLLMCVSTLAGCGDKAGSKPDALVVMVDQPDGLFNPFFSTAAADGTIVAMTQIGMLGAGYDTEKKEVTVAYGENEPVATKDYEIVENADGTITYLFVLKNGIQFADGHPLTMEDVLFNYYVYLDPVYTGSNTLYSTKIVGLNEYRTQTVSSSSGSSSSLIDEQAATRAEARRMELINLFQGLLKTSSMGEVPYEDMKAAIQAHSVSSGYQSAISTDPSSVTNEQLLADYEQALKLFKEELNTDFTAATQQDFNEEPYKSHAEFSDDVFKFMFNAGYVEITYPEGEDGKQDRTKFESLRPKYGDSIDTKEEAIEYVYNDNINGALDIVLQYWATGSKLYEEYKAQAKEVILRENSTGDDLLVPNISGIVSLGHSDRAGETITINGTDYTIASGHNADGTVTNTAEYDVLSITIEDIDPKAIWNFALTVAPQHYYGEGSKVGVDIENNKFGVEYASFDFMKNVIQSTRNIKLPMGAGAYRVTDRNNSDTPAENAFFVDNVAYFKRNDNFHTVGEGLENAKIEKLRYQVVTSNNAISKLESGEVHYISPALTKDNWNKLENLKSSGINTLTTDQLGYGYIGINAKEVTDINLRKAIMCAMNTSLALDYYMADTASQIYWPMSKVSWAYPDGETYDDNGHEYPAIGRFDEESARTLIKEYMNAAGVSEGDGDLKVKFTIAGANLTDHPTYKVFRDAAALLNSMGWEVEVACDTQALTKINTGSLEVWAAAWGSALDPDLYQVYHKDSTATSTTAWGYPYLKSNGTDEELDILDNLADLIDAARATNDQEERADLYEDAMGYILDLAIELPVYQRSVVYSYNSNVIKESSLPDADSINPFSSPLDRIWEVEFAD